MKNLLFLTDFSETSKNAFVYALSMAASIRASVHILHIVPVIPPKDEEEAFSIHPVAQMINQQTEQIEWGKFRAEATLLENIAKNHNLQEVPVEFHFIDGYFSEVVESFVQQNNIDAVVVGSAKKNTVDRKLFGTHTGKLLEILSVPLLAVPSKAAYSQINKFAVGVLMNDAETKNIEHIAGRLRVFGNSLQCIHIVKTKEEYQKAQSEKERWLSKFSHRNVSLDIKLSSSTIRGLEEYVGAEKIDVLCTLHRHLTFLQRIFTKTVSTTLLENERTTVLIFNFDE